MGHNLRKLATWRCMTCCESHAQGSTMTGLCASSVLLKAVKAAEEAVTRTQRLAVRRVRFVL